MKLFITKWHLDVKGKNLQYPITPYESKKFYLQKNFLLKHVPFFEAFFTVLALKRLILLVYFLPVDPNPPLPL